MADLAKGHVQTVLGPIEPSKVGRTLCHEHLYIKESTGTWVSKTPNPHSHLNATPVSVSTLWYTAYHPYCQLDNFDLTEPATQEAIVDELRFYKQNGGGTIVDLSTFAGGNPKALAELSRKSGVNVVGYTGYHVKDLFPDEVTSRSMEQLYDGMRRDLVEGVDGIKAGVIGEIGTSWPIHQFEKNVLLAAAHLQSELNVPVIIHPAIPVEAPFEVMRLFTEAGGKASKTVMSHLDLAMRERTDKLLDFATDTKAICELDMFGNEVSYFAFDDVDMPNDATRIKMVKALIGEGHGDRITISQDIHLKSRLMKYGGHGFSHILLNVVPKMLQRGITQRQIDQMLISTPRQWLTL